MAKKTFKTEQLNKISAKEKRAWLLFPAIMIILTMQFGSATFIEISKDNFISEVLFFLILDFFCAVMLGIIPFMVIRAKLRGAKKEAFKNCSFITVNDLDYYREKLTGLNPGAISILEDLKIEEEKDISACILRYENLGIIKEENGNYTRILSDISQMHLRKSDEYLINQIVKGKFEDKDNMWKKMVIEETKEDGLLVDKIFKYNSKKSQLKNGLLILLWFMVISAMSLFMVAGEIRNQYEESGNELLESIPSSVFVCSDVFNETIDTIDSVDNMSFDEQMQYLSEQPHFFYKLFLMCIMCVVYIIVLLFPVYYFKYGIARMKGRANYKRTSIGNEYAEYIWGMKNFIHDYSNLSEADKDALVLWDDYLIYAVVLEENRQIVNSIMNRKNMR